MADGIIEHAPAKVNLSLHVTGRRADGYHLLESLVVFTEAGDSIHVRPAQRDAFSVEGPFAGSLAAENDNLVLRARDLMRSLADDARPVEIVLQKNLPVASGIGGGSSDAAATLRALARHWNVCVDGVTLARHALALGADLPICLVGQTLVARGIGDDTVLVNGLPSLALVLVNPGVAVPTPAVFRALASRDNPPLPPLPVRPDFAGFTQWLAQTRNDLQKSALSVAPVIAEALEALEANDAALARMSGSGATCFGLFASDEAAERAARTLAAARPSWYVKATRTLEKAPADVTP